MTSSAAVPDVEESVPRKGRMPRLLRIALAVTAIIHLPVAFGVSEMARRLGWVHPTLIGWTWAAAGVSLFLGRVRAGMPDRRRNEALVRLGDIPYFIHWCAALWALIPSLVAVLIGPALDLLSDRPVRLPVAAFMWSYLSGLVVCSYGVLVRRRWTQVVERAVIVPGLDPRLSGLRVAHLSDLHIGAFTPRSWGLAWAKSANRRAPDVTVVTGDLVTSGTEFHADVADVVGALQAKNGVFASMGNHDYFGDAEPLVAMLRERGVGVLRNEGVVIAHGGAHLWLAAIDDTWTRRDDIALAMRGRPEGATVILLAHDPGRFDEAAAAGADIVLSGHTHGGQVALPFLARLGNLSRLAYRYTLGFYRIGGSVLYVHPGLGTTGPPIRLGVAPEVTILVLRPAPVKNGARS